MSKLSVVSLVMLLFFSCVNTKKENKPKYNFSIIYDYVHPVEREDKYRHKFSNDKLHLFFESEFSYDTISIRTNKDEIKDVIKTEPSSGLAKIIELDNFDKVSTLFFSVNNSSEVSFETIDKNMNLIGVRKRENHIELVFYKRVPIFD